MGSVPILFPPMRKSALSLCPFHQKKTPTTAEKRSMRPKMKYSSQPNFSMSSSLVKSLFAILAGLGLEGAWSGGGVENYQC